MIKPKRLLPGDAIGVVSPCYAARPERLSDAIHALEQEGFAVKLSPHLYSESWGYAASAEERVSDLYTMLADESVKMLLFGGGEVSNELLPLLDFSVFARHPKLLCSYSDSTTLLNAVWANAGLVTYNGASPRTFFALSDYNRESFYDRFLRDRRDFARSGPWKILRGGAAEGVLIGGYLVNYALLVDSPYYQPPKGEKYLLFLEDHLQFNTVPAAARYLAHIAQSALFENVSALLFGHFADEEQPLLDEVLLRLAARYDIPCARCDDFGHGANNGVLPIGVRARLDTANQTLHFMEDTVG